MTLSFFLRIASISIALLGASAFVSPPPFVARPVRLYSTIENESIAVNGDPKSDKLKPERFNPDKWNVHVDKTEKLWEEASAYFKKNGIDPFAPTESVESGARTTSSSRSVTAVASVTLYTIGSSMYVRVGTTYVEEYRFTGITTLPGIANVSQSQGFIIFFDTESFDTENDFMVEYAPGGVQITWGNKAVAVAPVPGSSGFAVLPGTGLWENLDA